MSRTIGLDIGGTKIAGGVVDEDGTVLARARRATPPSDPAAIAATCADLVAELRAEVPGVSAVGAACAGLIDATQSVVLFAPNLAWREEPLRERLTAVLDLPVLLENDANAAAWGEFRHGAAAHVDDMLFVTVGTGVGGGAVVDGHLLRGAFGVGAEIGHMRVVPGGHRCGCGNRGCLEQYASGSALIRDARELVRVGGLAAAALSARCGGVPKRLSGRDVDELALAGDPASIALLAEVGTWLGEGIASLGAVLDPGAVVLGGGVSHAGELLLGPVREALLRNLVGRGHRPEPQLVIATLGNTAGFIGAADLARGPHLAEAAGA
ncbi:MAG TPA: ROK family glucokinase [Dermatophilaceae bacterium]|nr:ROK family glucokinase [Dermatophilaceae bacterium]